MNRLHDDYLSGKDANEGKVPVVTIEGTERVTIQTPKGELVFKALFAPITQWIDRGGISMPAPHRQPPRRQSLLNRKHPPAASSDLF